MPIRHFLDVGTEDLGNIREFVKTDLGREHRIRGILGSAERKSMKSRRSWLRLKGAPTGAWCRWIVGFRVPTTMRSGFMKSPIAAPSPRIPFDTTSKSISGAAFSGCRGFAVRPCPRAHRNRGFVHHDLEIGHVLSHRLRNLCQDILQVGGAILVGQGCRRR